MPDPRSDDGDATIGMLAASATGQNEAALGRLLWSVWMQGVSLRPLPAAGGGGEGATTTPACARGRRWGPSGEAISGAV